jgi:midasin
MQLHERTIPFVAIHSSLLALERIARSVKHNELVLLVGETGTGKTTLVQNLALRLGQKLTVLVCCILLYYVVCYLKLY